MLITNVSIGVGWAGHGLVIILRLINPTQHVIARYEAIPGKQSHNEDLTTEFTKRETTEGTEFYIGEIKF